MEVNKVFKGQLAGYEYEHIFCDNASSDSTVSILRRIANKDKRVKIIINSEILGLPSTFNGLLNSKGNAVLALLPADLQDPPELIPEMVKRWEDGAEVSMDTC